MPFKDQFGFRGRKLAAKAPEAETTLNAKPAPRSLKDLTANLRIEFKRGQFTIERGYEVSNKIRIRRSDMVALANWILDVTKRLP